MIVIVSSHLGVRVLPGGLSAARCVCTCSLQIWRRTPSYRSWVWTCTPSSCCLRSLFLLRPSPPSPESHGHADTYGSAAGSYTNRGGWWWWQTNSIYCCEPLCGMYTVWMLRFNHWFGSSGVRGHKHRVPWQKHRLLRQMIPQVWRWEISRQIPRNVIRPALHGTTRTGKIQSICYCFMKTYLKKKTMNSIILESVRCDHLFYYYFFKFLIQF